MPERILYVLDDYIGPIAGTEAQLWLLYQLLDPGQWDAKFVSLRRSEYLTRHLSNAQYEVLDITRLYSPRAIFRACRFAWRARRAGYRLAHLYFNDVCLLLPPILWLFGIRVIVSRRDLGFWYTERKLKALRVNRTFVDRVIANCEAVKAVVVRDEQVPPLEIATVLNGCLVPATPPLPTTFRRNLGIGAGEVLVGMVANLRPLKRVADAIRAVHRLRTEHRLRVHLLVAGADRSEHGQSHRRELDELVRELGMERYVHFVGGLPNPWGFLRAIDLFVSCSETEGLSNSIVEAEISGVPVVATAVGGTPEIVRHGETGLLYVPGDLDALTGALKGLVEDPLRREAMGRAAKAYAEVTFDVQRMVRETESVYRRVLGLTS